MANTATLVPGRKRWKLDGLSQAEIDSYTAGQLEKVARRVVGHLKKRDLSGANVSALGVALGICIDKARLLRGASTANVAIAGRVDAVIRVQALATRLQGALEPGPATPIPPPDNASSQLAQLETVEAEAVETAEPVYEPVKRQRGRPRKVKALPTP